jgi:chitodextrinase
LSRSNYIVVTNPPAAPSVLMMNSLTISNGNVIMGWNPGTNLGPFQLVCRTNFNDTWHKFGSVVNGTKATNPVPQGAACFFAVTTDLSAPTAPTSPLATINSCSQVTVTWNASSDSGGGGLRGYNLYRNGSFLRQVPAGVTSSVDPGLAALTAYLYGISAVDIVGNESAQTLALSVTTPVCADLIAPSTPTGLSATAASCSQINLSWNASTDTGGSGLNGYEIYRGGTYVKTVTTTSTSDTGLAASTSYSYTVKAIDNAGNRSSASTAAGTTTPACPDTTPPSVPTGVTASAASCSQINLSWNTSTDTGGSGLSGYEIYRNGAFLKSVTANFTSDTGLPASTGYSYTVLAIDGAGNRSAQSTAAGATTPACADVTPPSVPTGFTATATSCSQVRLTWTASTDTGGSGLKGYNIYRDGNLIYQVLVPSVLINDGGLAASTSYSYRISAVDNANNESAQSAPSNAITPPCSDTTPPTTTLTSPTSGSTVSNTVTLTATASDNVGVTRVEFYCNGSVLLGVATNAPYSRPCDTTSLPNGTHSFFSRAFDAAGNSNNSTTVSVTINNATIVPWVKGLGGAGSDSARSVAVDGSGNSVMAGYFSGTADFGGGNLTSAGGFDIVIAKYSAAGNHIWSKRFGGTGDETVNRIALDSNGNVLVVGYFTGTADFGGGSVSGTGGRDMFIAKYSATGAYVWAKTFGGSTGTDDVAYGVATDASGNVIVTGYFSGQIDFGTGPLWSAFGGLDTFLVKFTSAGVASWAENFTNTGDDQGRSVAVDSAGNIVLTGYYMGSIDFGGGSLVSLGGSDVFVAKFSPAGAHLWSHTYGSIYADFSYSVAVDTAGNIFLSGSFFGTADINFGGGALPRNGSTATFLVKLSSAGAHVWSKSFTGTGDNSPGGGVTTDASGNVLISGGFYSTISLGGSVMNSTAFNIQGVYVGKFSSTGTHLWSQAFNGTSSESSTGIATDATGHVMVTGLFPGTATFNSTVLSCAGVTDMFLLRLDP